MLSKGHPNRWATAHFPRCPQCGDIGAVRVKRGGRAYVKSRGHQRGIFMPRGSQSNIAVRVYWPQGRYRSTVAICDHPIHQAARERSRRWMTHPEVYALLASYDPDESEGPARMVPGPPSAEEAKARRKAKARRHKDRQASR